MLNAFLIDKSDSIIHGAVIELDESILPRQGLEIQVEYSSFNYKDAMAVLGLGGLVKRYPHVPGIDLAGTVTSSTDDSFSVGDKVIVTGWRVGESYWGGFATKASVQPEFAVKLPANLSTFHAMALGTAGLSAMLAIKALEFHGLDPSTASRVLVTGAVGGVGSIAVLALSQLGYSVVASTGRLGEIEYLRSLGALGIIGREELSEPSPKPLESERWSGAIDSVGGSTLGRIIGQLEARASVAAVGLAGGNEFTSSLLPLLLRGINILGIDSTTHPNHLREAAWSKLGDLIPRSILNDLTTTATLSDISQLSNEIIKGRIKGRVVINPNK